MSANNTSSDASSDNEKTMSFQTLQDQPGRTTLQTEIGAQEKGNLPRYLSEERLKIMIRLLAATRYLLRMQLFAYELLVLVRRVDPRITPVLVDTSVDRLTSEQIQSLKITLHHDTEEAKKLSVMRKTVTRYSRVLDRAGILLLDAKKGMDPGAWEILDKDVSDHRKYLKALPVRIYRELRRMRS